MWILACGLGTALGQDFPDDPDKPADDISADASAQSQVQALSQSRAASAFRFESSNTMTEGDATLWIFQAPRIGNADAELRATWAVCWVDSKVDPFSTRSSEPKDPARELALGQPFNTGQTQEFTPATPAPAMLQGLFDNPQLRSVREIYFEGPVEYFVKGRRIAFADAVYLDRIDGHGWIAGADYSFAERLGGSDYVLKVQADWLRISTDGSLASKRAKLTTSEFGVPSYYVMTGNLLMRRTPDPEYPYEVRLKNNVLRIRDWFNVPLPPINYLANEEGEPSLAGIRLGQEARFGTVVGFEYSRDVREELGDKINRWLGGDAESYRARFRFKLNWFGSRGILFDPALQLRSGDNYVLNTAVGVIPDGARDRGLIQVPEQDRSGLRTWLRSRGRFKRSTGEWIDTALTVQTDAAVQSEFFEDDYLRYEERDSFINWHKTTPGRIQNLIVSGPINAFNGGIGRLPEYNFVQQRHAIAKLFDGSLHHGYDFRLGVYDRKEGDPLYEAPFVDGFGQATVLRGFHRQRLELPLALGTSGAIATPFIDLNATLWSESGTEESAIGRLLGVGGLKLSQVFWRGNGETGWQEVAPFVGFRKDFLEERSAAAPFQIDEIETLLTDGEFTDLGLRARADFPLLPAKFDGELRFSHVDQSSTLSTGWRPVGVFVSMDTSVGPIPLRVSHDGRYDFTSGETVYSNTLLDLYPHRDLDLQLAFARGLDELGNPRFEAATVGALYRFTPKWDIEGRQQLNLLDDTQLGSSIRIKRYGHDLLFELGIRYRAGEGTSFGIGIKPLLSANRRSQTRLALFAD